MAPRSRKRKFKARHPIPLWLPLPRPCLRSLNMPGPPYYMPISPEMYLPPWTIPPSYFTKPLCHCANENFCTATNCQNSTECLKMHPMFCPHSSDLEEGTHLQQNITEQQHDSDDGETTSNSDINICSACGAPSNKLRTSGKKNYFQGNQPNPDHTSRVTISQDSSHNVKKGKHSLEATDAERNDISITSRSKPLRERVHRTDSGNSSSETTPSNKYNGCVDSSCQTASSNSRNRFIHKKYNANSTNKDKRYSGSMSDFEDSRSSDLETDKRVDNFNKNDFGCSSCTGQNSGPAHELETHNVNSMSAKEREPAKTKKLKTDSLHIEQLPDNLSSARKKQANKYSGCCLPGSKISCKTDIEMDTVELQHKNKSRKNSGSEPTKSPGKALSKSPKLSDCICSSSNTQHESTKFRKKLKCECYPNKISQKTKHQKVSECSCPSSDLPYLDKDTSKSRKLTENCTEGSKKLNEPKTSSSKLTTKKSKKSLSDAASLSKTNVKQSGCQCKFPPAYKHFSCTGNESNNCNCSKNI